MALQLEKGGLLPIGLGVVVCGWEGRGEGIGVWARVVAAVRAAWNLINQLNSEHNRTPRCDSIRQRYWPETRHFFEETMAPLRVPELYIT